MKQRHRHIRDTGCAHTPTRLFTCVKLSHSSVSYSCTKVSFPFLLHTSGYFWATSVKLETAGAHAQPKNAHARTTRSNMQNPLGVFWESERSRASFMMRRYNS